MEEDTYHGPEQENDEQDTYKKPPTFALGTCRQTLFLLFTLRTPSNMSFSQFPTNRLSN